MGTLTEFECQEKQNIVYTYIHALCLNRYNIKIAKTELTMATIRSVSWRVVPQAPFPPRVLYHVASPVKTVVGDDEKDVVDSDKVTVDASVVDGEAEGDKLEVVAADGIVLDGGAEVADAIIADGEAKGDKLEIV
jgi:hypothetical protein